MTKNNIRQMASNLYDTDLKHSLNQSSSEIHMNNGKSLFDRLFKKNDGLEQDQATTPPVNTSGANDTSDLTIEDFLGEEMRPFNTPKTYQNAQSKSAHRM